LSSHDQAWVKNYPRLIVYVRQGFDFIETELYQGSMIMKTIKKTKDYSIFQKRSGRYAVQGTERQWIRGEDKVKILVKEKLLKIKLPKPKEEPKPEPEVKAAKPETKAAEPKTKEPKVKPEATDKTKEEPTPKPDAKAAEPKAEAKPDAKPQATAKAKENAPS